jgi:hypothetical protein
MRVSGENLNSDISMTTVETVALRAVTRKPYGLVPGSSRNDPAWSTLTLCELEHGPVENSGFTHEKW